MRGSNFGSGKGKGQWRRSPGGDPKGTMIKMPSPQAGGGIGGFASPQVEGRNEGASCGNTNGDL